MPYINVGNENLENMIRAVPSTVSIRSSTGCLRSRRHAGAFEHFAAEQHFGKVVIAHYDR